MVSARAGALHLWRVRSFKEVVEAATPWSSEILTAANALDSLQAMARVPAAMLNAVLSAAIWVALRRSG